MDLKDLKELIKLLRKEGVQQYQDGTLVLVLSEEVPKSSYKKRQEEVSPDGMEEPLEFDDMTLDQQLAYSATHPLEAETEQ